jgi:hypothetical protein
MEIKLVARRIEVKDNRAGVIFQFVCLTFSKKITFRDSTNLPTSEKEVRFDFSLLKDG